MLRVVIGCVVGLSVGLASAAPRELITHNDTEVTSNAYINGNIQSPHPTKPNSVNRVAWNAVILACYGHTKSGNKNICSADIKINTNEQGAVTAETVDIGTLEMNLKTGEITPQQINGNGYMVVVNGPGETTISRVPGQ